jgi:hypothetical protein
MALLHSLRQRSVGRECGSSGSAAEAAIVLAGLLVLACPAAAVDGEILINQKAAIAGGITPGDAAGFPVSITRRGRYKLTSDLIVPANTNGIEVVEHDVTIDLNGHSILGGNVANRGINAAGVGGFTVMNGTIRGFKDFGIFNNGAFVVIDSARVIGNGAVGIFVGDDARVRKSTVSDNTFGGIQCGQRCLIQQNLVTLTSPGSGVILQQGGVALGNTVALNDGFGIVAIQGPVGFGDNSLSNNNHDGPQISGNVLPLNPNSCTPAC